MRAITPIILLASERSGTNLLRALVSSHSAVASPPPCSIVDVLADYAFRYFPPSRPPHLRELAQDAITLTKSHLNPWDIDLTPQAIIERMGQASFWELFKVINELYAEKAGRTYWFSKEPGLFRHIYEIKMHMPNARFVYMARDGRDVAASMIKGGIQEFHIYNAAHHWASDQRYCLGAFADPMLRNSIHFMKYEDLIENQESEMRRLMSFVGLGFEPSQLEFYKRKSVIDHAEKSRFWKNLAKPIDASNKGKYRESLGAKKTVIFESVAWAEMLALGYPLESKSKMEITVIQRGVYWFIALLRKIGKRFDMNKESARIRARTKVFREIRSRSFSS